MTGEPSMLLYYYIIPYNLAHLVYNLPIQLSLCLPRQYNGGTVLADNHTVPVLYNTSCFIFEQSSITLHSRYFFSYVFIFLQYSIILQIDIYFLVP